MNAAPKHIDADAIVDGGLRDKPQLDAQAVSCFLDGELDGPEGEQALSQLLANAGAQMQWEIMHAVGDALRSSDVAAQHRAGFVARCRARLEQEPTIVAPRWANDRRKLMRHVVLPGAMVAAAAVMLTVVAVPQLIGGGSMPVVANEPVATPVVTVVADPAVSSSTRRAIAPYLHAHREITPSGVLPAGTPYLRTSATLPSEAGQ